MLVTHHCKRRCQLQYSRCLNSEVEDRYKHTSSTPTKVLQQMQPHCLGRRRMNMQRIAQRSNHGQHPRPRNPSNRGLHTLQGRNSRVQAKRQLGRCCPPQAAHHTLGIGSVGLMSQHRRRELSPRGNGPNPPPCKIEGLEGQHGIPDRYHSPHRNQLGEVLLQLTPPHPLQLPLTRLHR